MDHGEQDLCDWHQVAELRERIRSQGFVELLTRLVATPKDLQADGAASLREGLSAFGRNSRTRAVLQLIEEQLGNGDCTRLVTTNEVLEHVPSINGAPAAIFRVLKPGGWHVGTHPFLFMNRNGLVRAELIDER